ncbi:MAG: hypothetical protein ISN28_14775, partial [Ectothiorhodospiraceae bacterium AqS1]|nr:hypothetical protein [Ectothiorhodospiraceae bacterium AqS1]
TIDTDSATAGNQDTLTFTAANYEDVQTVSVTAGNDTDSAGDTDTITFTATGGIDASPVTKAVSITDNDAPAGTIVVTPSTDLSIDEGDTTGATLSVNLTGTPNANVTVTLTSSDSDVTLDPASLTFTAGNAGTVQPVTVKAGEDSDTVHETVTITLAATGGISASNVTKTVKVNDNDKPTGAIEISPTGTLDLDEGDTTGGTFTVKLSALPNNDVTVTLTNTNTDVTIDTDSATAGNQTTLTFTESNYNAVQTVTVKAAEDADATDDTDTITLSATGGITASNVTKQVAIDDDEPPAGNIEVSPAGRLTIAEGGTGELKVKLSAQPESSVTVALSKTNDDISLSGSDLNGNDLTFTTENYGTEQTVTVTAAEDDDDSNDDTDIITFTATGGITASAVTKDVTVTDDDAPSGAIEVTPAGALTIDEGGSQTLSIKLDTLPDSTVTVTLSKTDADVTLDPTSLTFTVGNYDEAQTVDVSTSHDDDADDDTDTITISASGGITATDVTKDVTITDDDDPRVTIDVTPSGTLSIDEGDSSGATLMVKLSKAPKANVNATVTLEKTNPD